MDKKRASIPRWLRWVIFVVAVVLMLVHTLSTELTSVLHLTLTVDSLTVALVVLACLPWLIDRITGIKAGDVEISLSDVQQPVKELEEAAKSQADKTVELTATATGGAAVSAKMTAEISGSAAIAPPLPDTSDPVMLFAVVRLEIERRLNTLAEVSGIATSPSALSTARMLAKGGVMPLSVYEPLKKFISLANAAIHGVEVAPEAVDEARSSVPSILALLDSLIAQASVSKDGN